MQIPSCTKKETNMSEKERVKRLQERKSRMESSVSNRQRKFKETVRKRIYREIKS